MAGPGGMAPVALALLVTVVLTEAVEVGVSSEGQVDMGRNSKRPAATIDVDSAEAVPVDHGEQRLLRDERHSATALSAPHASKLSMGDGAHVAASIMQEEDWKGPVRTHAVVQVLAWSFAAPVAMLTKRFGGQNERMSSVKVFGSPLPFVLHGVLMLSVVLCSSTSAAVTWANNPKPTKYGHGYVALVVTLLAASQAIVAIFVRPNLKDNSRDTFNTAHKTCGAILVTLAIVTIFLGVLNYKERVDESEGTRILVTACVGFFCLCFLPYAFSLLFRRGTRSGEAAGFASAADDPAEWSLRTKAKESPAAQHG